MFKQKDVNLHWFFENCVSKLSTNPGNVMFCKTKTLKTHGFLLDGIQNVKKQQVKVMPMTRKTEKLNDFLYLLRLGFPEILGKNQRT